MKILLSLSMLALLTAVACGPKHNDVRDAARESLGVNNTSAAATPASQQQTPQQTPTSPPSINGVYHYICPNNCEGSGGGEAGMCPVCGTAYAHNDAYHQQQQAQPTGDQQIVTQKFSGNTDAAATTPAAATPEPAQNAAGVWHYTCPNGCDGGAGTATACAKCGSTLAHNQAYHQ